MDTATIVTEIQKVIEALVVRKKGHESSVAVSNAAATEAQAALDLLTNLLKTLETPPAPPAA
jgi:pyruvate/2-oxoglutarate/acetoin dehydrogenase E1 component